MKPFHRPRPKVTEDEELPRPSLSKKKRKVDKPFLIEYRHKSFFFWDSTEREWSDWKVDGRYATEKSRDEALQRKQSRSGGWNDSFQYRPAEKVLDKG